MKSELSPEERQKIRDHTRLLKASKPKRKRIPWSDVDERKDYVLVLFVSEDGARNVELKEVNSAKNASRGAFAFVTEIIPQDVLMAKNIVAISDNVKLENGDTFSFDSNGNWMTGNEFDDFKKGFKI